MNVIDFWKQHVEGRRYNEFDREEFINSLTDAVPNWRDEIKDRSIWPELHSQGQNVNETVYTKVFIDELGLEYTYYLIENQWGKQHLDASCALDYCENKISTDWDKFPEYVRYKILTFAIKKFMLICENRPEFWNSLSEYEKCKVIMSTISEEKNYVSDLSIYNLWKNELSFKKSPYVLFLTFEMRQRAQNMLTRWDERYDVYLLHRSWDKPALILTDKGDDLQYVPSDKVICLQKVINLVDDKKSKQLIDDCMYELDVLNCR